MKASIVIATYVFACALVLGPSASPQGKPKEQSMTMTGCLTKGTEPGTYALTNEKGVQIVVIAQSKANLAAHVGHKVEITGTTVPAKDTKVQTMNVTAVKHISATCP
jgi:hypothetical protein